MEQVELKVKMIVANQLSLNVNDFKNNDAFVKDLGADSLDTVALLIALEEALGVEMSDADALTIITVQDAINYANQTFSKKSNGIDHVFLAEEI